MYEVVEELFDERERLDAQSLTVAELVEPLAQVHVLLLGDGRRGAAGLQCTLHVDDRLI